MTVRLFYAPRTIALASHITLEEAGADYEAVRINFAENEQRKPEYLAVNPKGRVPALLTEQGILTETPAILAYIAQTHPKAGLAPLADPFAFATLQSFNAYLCSTMHPAHAHRIRGYRWSDDPAVIEQLKVKVPQNMTDCCAHIEGDLFKGPWVMGDTFTIADPYLYTIARWLEGDGVDTSRFPKILDHMARMQARPPVQRVLALHAA